MGGAASTARKPDRFNVVVDSDKDGAVSVAKLKALLSAEWNEERIKKLITVFDDDGNGELNDSEWKRACALLGELPERVGGLLKEKTRAAAEKAEAAEKAKAEKEVAAAETVAAATAEAETSKASPIEFPPGTPTDTQEAIRAEVDRVRQLPPAELAKLGTKYTDPEALWEALGALDGKATLILRGSWVKKQRGGRLPKRGDKLPSEALITVQELREIHAKAKTRYGALPAIALSHYWRTKEHPDPDGVTLGCAPTAAPPPNSARPASLPTPAPCRDAAQARHRRPRGPLGRLRGKGRHGRGYSHRLVRALPGAAHRGANAHLRRGAQGDQPGTPSERQHTAPSLSAPLSPANRLVRSGMRTKAPPCGASRPAKAPTASATMTRVGRRSSTGSR